MLHAMPHRYETWQLQALGSRLKESGVALGKLWHRTVFFLHGVKQIITDKSWIQNWKHNLFVMRNPQFSSFGFDLFYLLETSWPWTEPGLRKLVPTTKLPIYLPLLQKKKKKKNYLPVLQQNYLPLLQQNYLPTKHSNPPPPPPPHIPMYLPYNKTTCLPLLQQNYI